jgi:UDP-N-acetylglucosamine--N-acetylmuramyl-(pentapeptide) pyrophosphoryl-undecaprenol N-acetylglucosamine transferase
MSRPVILAAGGTGGHLFPAEALAGELTARGKTVVVVTDGRGAAHLDAVGGPLSELERHIVRAAAVSGRSMAGRVKGLIEIAAGAFQARRLIRQLDPAVAVGFGGYSSLPTMLAASWAGVPSVLHEQNAVLGRVNRLLAPRMTAIAISFADTAKLEPGDFAKVTVVGNPVRASVRAINGMPYSASENGDVFRLLVLGGSQGATVLSEILPDGISRLTAQLRSRLEVTQQCRAEDLDQVRARYKEAGINAKLATFFDDVPARLAGVHLIVSRAGASTVSEAAVAGRPVILVPYPYATDDHQTANARAITVPGGGWQVSQSDFTPSMIAATLTSLMNDPAGLSEAAEAALTVGRTDAAPRLADLVDGLMLGGNGGDRVKQRTNPSANDGAEREEAA